MLHEQKQMGFWHTPLKVLLYDDVTDVSELRAQFAAPVPKLVSWGPKIALYSLATILI